MAASISLVLLATGGGLAALALRPKLQAEVPAAVVHVVLKGRWGTGFFVKGPDDGAYVATALHVVRDGQSVLVEREVPGAFGGSLVEAYPETEVVGFDVDNDLAILRIAHVRGDKFPSLPLAHEALVDEPVVAYGFGGSSLTKNLGLISKPGKVLSVAKFSTYDEADRKRRKIDVIDGVVVSADTEPGFSGGPTCNARGAVIGVNIRRDSAYRGQNGAVSVSALKALLSRLPAAKDVHEPTAKDVQELLARVEREYLLLPIEQRHVADELDFVSADDLPRASEFLTTLRRLDGDTNKNPKTKLSGQAVLGLLLARLPGHPFETLAAPSTREKLAACEAKAHRLTQFFGRLVPLPSPDELFDPDEDTCETLVFRPFVWDAAALALQWQGHEREISVMKVESADSSHGVYHAQARIGGLDYLTDVWVATDGGRLRLKLFDPTGKPAGLSAARAVDASELDGTWHRSAPRAVHSFGGIDADVDGEEILSVSHDASGTVTLTHALKRKISIDGGKRHFACTQHDAADVGLEQSFAGTLRDGSVVAFRNHDPKSTGDDAARCASLFTYTPDAVAVVKPSGANLVMSRSDGVATPEQAEFHR